MVYLILSLFKQNMKIGMIIVLIGPESSYIKNYQNIRLKSLKYELNVYFVYFYVKVFLFSVKIIIKWWEKYPQF